MKLISYIWLCLCLPHSVKSDDINTLLSEINSVETFETLVNKVTSSKMFYEPTSSTYDYALLFSYLLSGNEDAAEGVASYVYDMLKDFPQKGTELKHHIMNISDKKSKEKLYDYFPEAVCWNYGLECSSPSEKEIIGLFPFLKSFPRPKRMERGESFSYFSLRISDQLYKLHK